MPLMRAHALLHKHDNSRSGASQNAVVRLELAIPCGDFNPSAKSEATFGTDEHAGFDGRY